MLADHIISSSRTPPSCSQSYVRRSRRTASEVILLRLASIMRGTSVSDGRGSPRRQRIIDRQGKTRGKARCDAENSDNKRDDIKQRSEPKAVGNVADSLSVVIGAQQTPGC